MSNISIKEPVLYYLLSMVSFLLVFIATGPGLTGGTEGSHSFQHKVFHLLCHQDPVRSFHVNGHAMAVCSRCFGIYAGFFLTTMVMRFIIRPISMISQQLLLQLLVLSIVMNGVDVLGNMFSLWTNSLVSRSLLGLATGAFTALYLTDQFFTYKKTNGDLLWRMNK